MDSVMVAAAPGEGHVFEAATSYARVFAAAVEMLE